MHEKGIHMRPEAGSKRGFAVRPLSPDRVDEAYPVVRAAMPDLSLERWRDFASRAVGEPAVSPPPGIMLVESAQGYIYGLCAYRLQHDIRHGRVLVIEELVTLGLVDGASVAATLIAALEERARELGCAAMNLNMSDSFPPRPSCSALRDLLTRNGHCVDGVRLLKRIDRPEGQPPTVLRR